MFNVSISDRLKAAVNQLEATGTSLQARATANLNAAGQQQLQGQHGANAGKSGASGQAGAGGVKSPGIGTSPKLGTETTEAPGDDKAGTGATASPGTVTSPRLPSSDSNASTSPRATYGASAAHLADSALSGLTGLRKSFNFRGSQEGARPTAAQLAAAGAGSTPAGAKELKDMQASATGTDKIPSRAASPAGFLSATSFGIGSDPSTAAQTPRQPRSPTPARGLSKLRSPAHLDIDLRTPDPSDPSTYPLPPSPDTSSSALSAPLPKYADPLGASPLATPADDAVPAITSLQDDANEDSAAKVPVIGLGLSETDTELHAAEATLEAIDHGETPETAPEAAAGSSEAERKLQAINKIIRALTPLEGGVDDPDAIDGWVRMMKAKVEMTNQELVRLRGQMSLQDSRIEELRDTHRLEGSSQSTLITKLRSQLSTAESNLAARVADLSALAETKIELGRAQTQIKEEEEKRTKAIQLLKTVRLKLVKAEKDKEEVERDRAEERAERAKATEEVEKVRAEKEREVQRLRSGFERELAGQKERWEREMKDKKGAWELEMITTKASHARELSNKTTMVAGLEEIVRELSKTKDEQFYTIQARQSEAESARSESETLQNRTKELEFQLREANERIALLEEASSSSARSTGRGRTNGFLDADRQTASPSPSPAPSRRNSGSLPGPSPAEVQRIVADAEARAEAKLNDMRNRVRSLEKERNDLEEEWGTKLQERVRELEGLKRRIQEKESEYDESLRKVREVEGRVGEGVEERKRLEKEIQGLKDKAEEMAEDVATAQESEKSAKEETSQVKLQLQSLTSQVDEQKNLVANLRTANKTLREELRKVQSSVQLMEKQRNPGVGYWSATNHSSANGSAPGGAASGDMGSRTQSMSGEGTPMSESARKSMESSRTDRTGGTASNGAGGAGGKTAGANEEEEVNLEYLRNVIIQFLEHPHMRRQLVQVLSVILHFTPQELRRLNSKLTA